MNQNKSVFWSIFATFSFWIVVALLGAVFLHNCSRPHLFAISMADESLITEISERKGVVDWSQLYVDSLDVVHLAASIDSAAFMAFRDSVLRMEVRAGRLMTAKQLSDNIIGYYDKLIDVLIALFIIFTVVSYVVINSRFKEKYEEDKSLIIDEIKKSLIDSKTLQNDIENVVATRINKTTVTEDTIRDIRDKLVKNDEYFELLASVCDDLTEESAKKTEIIDPEDNLINE